MNKIIRLVILVIFFAIAIRYPLLLILVFFYALKFVPLVVAYRLGRNSRK